MSKEISEINWDDVLNKFTSYEGTIVNFCKEHGLASINFITEEKIAERN